MTLCSQILIITVTAMCADESLNPSPHTTSEASIVPGNAGWLHVLHTIAQTKLKILLVVMSKLSKLSGVLNVFPGVYIQCICIQLQTNILSVVMLNHKNHKQFVYIATYCRNVNVSFCKLLQWTVPNHFTEVCIFVIFCYFKQFKCIKCI
jgi:hypothetical protein